MLTSPYKYLAADANNSGSITTFDIVELRKLILGIYSGGIPGNTSWRFVRADYVFPALPSNPFTGALVNNAYKDCVDPSAATSNDFIGIKIGDVNDNVIPSSFILPKVNVTLEKAYNKHTRTLSVPVVYTGNKDLKAIQMGIHYDPAKLMLIGPSKGNLTDYTVDNFGLTRADEGYIRYLWFSMQDEFATIKTGTVLFYLTFEVLNNFSDSESLIYLDNDVLENSAWQSDGTEYYVRTSANVAARSQLSSDSDSYSFEATIQPNPTNNNTMLILRSGKNTKANIALFGAFGNLIFTRDFLCESGEKAIDLPEVSNVPAGVYFWKLTGENGLRTQGHLIKQ